MKKILLFALVTCFIFVSGCMPQNGNADDVIPERQEEADPVRMAMIERVLYRDVGKVSKLNPRCGFEDGEVVKTVEKDEIPYEDYTSNFGDYGYQNASETSKEFNIDGEWMVFESFYNWGTELIAENITQTGLTVVFKQCGGNITGELQTGDWYTLERFNGETWEDVEYKPQEYDIVWHSIAYSVSKDEETRFEVDWESLYGELPEGKYRIGKRVHDFRSTGDYDAAIVYGEFEIGEGI